MVCELFLRELACLMPDVEHPLGDKVQIDLPHGGAGAIFLPGELSARKEDAGA